MVSTSAMLKYSIRVNRYWVLFSVLLLFLISFEKSQGLTVNRKDIQKQTQHFKRVRDFKCIAPQPRALTVSEILEEEPDDDGHVHLNGDFIPPMSVLHRCDRSSGCCFGFQEECGPTSDGIEMVKLVFHVFNQAEGKSYYESITAANHTKCACQLYGASPK